MKKIKIRSNSVKKMKKDEIVGSVKMTWEDILPKEEDGKSSSTDDHYDCGYEQAICSCIEKLKQAEKEGKCCLNPPDEEDLWYLIRSLDINGKTIGYINDEDIKTISKTIVKRIKDGE